MTAFSGGGGRPPNGAQDPMSSVVERPEDAAQRARPRPLDQIFPLRGDANRGREMQATWRSFCRDRVAAVKDVLAAGRKPAEVAYQLGELLHNHFRTRGVTLTSAELRRLVAELLTLYGPTPPAEKPKVVEPKVVEKVEKKEPAREAAKEAVVSFGSAPPEQPWPGDDAPPPVPAVPDKVLEPPPSPVVTVAPREPVVREIAPFQQLLARALEVARTRLVSRDRTAARGAVDEAIVAVATEQGGALPEATQQRLTSTALSELIGLGLIDRLWADRSVRAVFVHGPQSVFVDRGGTLQKVNESFRDEAHLLELLGRLVNRPASGIAEFRLRDGSNGFVVFPPVAPNGPALTLRRAEPGESTLEQLLSIGLVDRTIAELLRLGVRSRLNMLVTGPRGAGKTALLAALVRDLDGSGRVVTVARHRQFGWPAASKVELVTSPVAAYATLVEAGARLEPALLVMDDVQLEDVAALSERLLRGGPGILAALGPETMSPALARSADLVVRLDRGNDGLFRAVSVEDATGTLVFHHDGARLTRVTATPAFAATMQSRGYGEPLAQLLR